MIGIYKITNHLGQIYIGSSNDIRRRWVEHRSTKHNINSKISKSILLYGHETHFFKVIEECSLTSLKIKENYWQNYYNSYSDFHLNKSIAKNRVVINGKIKRPLKINIPDFVYLDSATGIYFYKLKDMCKELNLNYSLMLRKMNGKRKNNTRFFKV